MDNILAVWNVSKKFKSSDFSLNNVSFSLPKGTIMGFIGENGAGKSTTINCILNIKFKDSGTIKIFGNEMLDDNIDIREKIGVVVDGNNFSPNLKADQLSKVMRNMYSNWDNAIFNEYLRKFSLPINQKFKTYSKGMAMKLAIAVALSHHAELLILDEATSGLDPIMRDDILEILLDFVQDENHSILISSHITSDLEKIADYITFIHDGEIILSTRKDDLLYKYGIARCTEKQFVELEKDFIMAYKKRDFQIDVLVNDKILFSNNHKEVVVDNVSIDEIMLLLIRGESI